VSVRVYNKLSISETCISVISHLQYYVQHCIVLPTAVFNSFALYLTTLPRTQAIL